MEHGASGERGLELAGTILGAQAFARRWLRAGGIEPFELVVSRLHLEGELLSARRLIDEVLLARAG